jgi:hypothetical protein
MKQRVLFMIEGISAVTLGAHEMPRERLSAERPRIWGGRADGARAGGC